MLQLYMIHCRRFEEIAHAFRRPGHTYNAADQDFACIERTLRTQQTIIDIFDYISLIKRSRVRTPFIVTKMEQSDFLDFSALKIMCVKQATLQESGSQMLAGSDLQRTTGEATSLQLAMLSCLQEVTK